MIRSFGDKETEKIWLGMRSSKLPNEIQDVARRKLRMLANSQNLSDLKAFLEALLFQVKELFCFLISAIWRPLSF